jgi:transcriptional regulator with XRE-family HTH domain
MEDVKKLRGPQWQLLVDWLEKEGMSQRAFAEDLDVTEGAVNHWINGRWAPQLDRLRAISKRTGVRLEKLIESLPSSSSTAA